MDPHDKFAGRELDILAALGIHSSGSRKHIKCPFPDHDDGKPSWRWDEQSCRWFCTCGNGSIFDAVMRMQGLSFKEAMHWCESNFDTMSDARAKVNKKLTPSPALTKPAWHVLASKVPTKAMLTHGKFGLPSAFWVYHDAHHRIFEVRARYDHDSGKIVIPWAWDGGKWINKQAPGLRPLFRLPDLLADAEPRILVVEGEKAARAAEKLFPDWSVTTTSGGCQAHKGMDYAPLKGRHVVIWPDNDDAGRGYAQAIAQHAHDAHAASVAIVGVPGEWPEGCDLADELPDSADLREMLEDAHPWLPQGGVARDLDMPAHDTSQSPELVPVAPTESDNAPEIAQATKVEYKFQIIPLFRIKPVLEGQWLIKKLLPATGLSTIYGPPGCGKSFLTLDAALHIAAGREWAKCRTKQVSVVYIAAEGQNGFFNRVFAAKEHLKLDDTLPFGLVTVAPDLGKEKGDAAVLIDEMKNQGAEFDWKIGLVVIDTLAQTIPGADESKSDGMGIFISNSRLISQALGCACVAVHHVGKDASLGMRGWSGLDGACDAEWAITNEDGKHSAFLQKMKDGQDGLSWDFSLTKTEIGVDSDGDPVTTCLVDVPDGPQQKTEDKNVARPALKGQAAEFYKAIKWAVEDAGIKMPGIGRAPAGVPGVTKETLEKYVKNLSFFDGKPRNTQRSVMSRNITTLAGNKHIGHWQEWVWLL